MKTFLLVLCLCLVHTHFVNSGVILDKISSGFTQARQKVQCGFHKIGSSIISHEHHHTDPCNNNENKGVETNRIDTDEVKTQEVNKDSNVTSNSSSIQATTQKTEATHATVPNGKRLIAVGANCPAGQRGDGRGNCREEY